MTMTLTRPVILLAALALITGGCYKLGSSLPPDLKTIYVPVLNNKADYPQLESDVTSALKSKFQFDNSLKPVSSRDNADLILDGEITSMTLTTLSYNRNRNSTASSYRMTLTAKVTVTKRRDGSFILQDAEIKGSTTFAVTADLTLSKRLAVRDAAEDLGQNIVNSITGVW